MSKIEIFDGNLLAYENREDEFKSMLSDNNVSLLAVYCAGNFIYDEILIEEMFRIEKAARFAKKFGATQIALGGGATRWDKIRESDYDKLAQSAGNKVCDMAEKIGMTASFHPHMGSLVQSPEQIDKVMSKTRIALCPGLRAMLCWGGGDPVEGCKEICGQDLLYTS